MSKCALCGEEFQPDYIKTRGGEKMDKLFHTECYWITKDPQKYERLVKYVQEKM
jgi:hypothetical protein